MDFRILGPLQVEDDGRPVALGGPKQRALLALLVLHVNKVASRERLIDDLWGDRAPETAATALQGYVSALRKTVGPERILTRAPGYVLQVDPEAVDLGRREPAPVVVPNSLAKIDPRTNEVVDVIGVGRFPGKVASGDGFVWVVNIKDETLTRVAPDSGRADLVAGLRLRSPAG